MRTASDFDRAPPGEDDVFHLLYAEQGGFPPSIQNIYIAGATVVEHVLDKWDSIYASGVPVENYIGDLFNSLDSPYPPDIGSQESYIN